MVRKIFFLIGMIVLACCFSGCVGRHKTVALGAFLSLPLEKNTPFHITQGWEYSDDERIIHPDIKTHFAVDFAAERGTPVYAAADGFAIASYQSFYITDSQGRRIGFGLGKFVQIWHSEVGVFTSYSHLERIADTLVNSYIVPEQRQGDLGTTWYPAIVNRPLSEVIPLSKEVNKGELIGYVGDSGLSLGYDDRPDDRPDSILNPSWDPAGPHLHFEVYGRNGKGNKKPRYDPFDLHVMAEKYQNEDRTLNVGPNPLWILDETGQPRFVK